MKVTYKSKEVKCRQVTTTIELTHEETNQLYQLVNNYYDSDTAGNLEFTEEFSRKLRPLLNSCKC